MASVPVVPAVVSVPPVVDPFTWKSVKRIRVPSGGGKGGTVMITLQDDKTYFVKGMSGSAARTLFAEFMLEKFGQAHTPKSTIIIRTDPQFAEMKQVILKALVGAELRNKTSDIGAAKIAEEQKNIKTKINMFTTADYFAVMQPARGMEMGEMTDPTVTDRDAKLGFLETCLADEGFLRQMGMLLAVDSLLGNHDRVQGMNTGNMFINTATKQISVIDNDTLMPSFEMDKTHHFTGSKRQWAGNIVQKGLVPNKEETSADIDEMSDLSKVTGAKFSPASYLKGSMQSHNAASRTDPSRPNNQALVARLDTFADWKNMDEQIRVGYTQGLASITRSEFNWQLVKTMLREFAAQYNQKDFGVSGGLFDLDALRVRIRYLDTRAGGATHEAALEKAAAFAEGRDTRAKDYVAALEAATRNYAAPGRFAKFTAAVATSDRALSADIATVRNAGSTKEQIRAIITRHLTGGVASVGTLPSHTLKLVVLAFARLSQMNNTARAAKVRQLIREAAGQPPALKTKVYSGVRRQTSESVSLGDRYLAMCVKVEDSNKVMQTQLRVSIDLLKQVLREMR